jgi:alkylation response protein AidB-like acyl-CoA dehydrogenase
VSYLKVFIPADVIGEIERDLISFGDKVASEYLPYHHDAERNPPTFEKYTGFGEKVNTIRTSEGWRYFKHQSAVEGLVAIPYENKQKQFSRIYQMAKLFMFSCSSGLYSCPLSMTDGAAFTIRSLRREGKSVPSQLDDAYTNLTSRGNNFWTSGQWMTEKKGGSDVAGGTTTLAVKDGEAHKLYGYKWFTSAVDSDMSLTLGRDADSNLKTTAGTKGLSMYFLKIRNPDQSLNNVDVVRMKNKLGTRQLPTAELVLEGSKVLRVGEAGKGIKQIGNMLNITRFHNAIGSIGSM